MPVLLAPPIQVRQAPPSDPPYDDEVTREPAPLTQQPLPLDWLGVAGRAAISSGAGRRPGGATAAAARAAAIRDARGPVSAAHAAALRFLYACLEVLNGYRPAAHLRPLTAPAEFLTIAAELADSVARVGAGGDPTGPRGRTRAGATRVCLRDLKLCELPPDV
ncbi:MAG TPA: Rv3235 family protein, partial [Micromonosporaceae bacterium]|nr:Rv3235 family protein [Micromonosporaceae bacterium]